VKPFAARELLARVQTHLDLARLRRDWSSELERANHELEAFSYSVSHDLRAPLRAIDGFTKIFIRDHASQIDEEGRRCLARVCAGTQRMAQLIDDLLSLSQITRASMRRERVDVTDVARKIMVELEAREPERTVDARVCDGLTVRADPHLLRVMLENLLGNAWKFTGKQPAATIEVGQEERDGETAFFVRDNGAGFNMEYAKKLFTPFQRLHSETEFEGTGIGLATVQRVVTRHGGRIWAEGLTGQGATFFFTLGEEP
jgi:light-regulated signal transduction histidine kinase (bacteriophytochrome)